MINKHSMYTKLLIVSSIFAASLCCATYAMENTYQTGTIFSQKNQPSELIEKTDAVVKVWGSSKNTINGPGTKINCLEAAKVTTNGMAWICGARLAANHNAPWSLLFSLGVVWSNYSIINPLLNEGIKYYQKTGLGLGQDAHDELCKFITALNKSKSSLSIDPANAPTVKGKIETMNAQLRRLPELKIVDYYELDALNKSKENLQKSRLGLKQLITFGQEELFAYESSSATILPY